MYCCASDQMMLPINQPKTPRVTASSYWLSPFLDTSLYSHATALLSSYWLVVWHCVLLCQRPVDASLNTAHDPSELLAAPSHHPRALPLTR